jgi:hypothetical protein
VVIADDGRMDLVLEDRGARCLAVDPADPDVLYVGTDDEGVFGSRDGGHKWGRLPGIEHPRITAVAVSPVDGPWETVVEHLDAFPYALAADPGVSGSLYAGLGNGVILGRPAPNQDWREVARVPGGVSALAIVG